ncbi:efflux RND transporter permease subunit [Pseudomonas sp. 10B1]|uniref:efflux RND transporter permease subunit n=1 Tax=unclassified Pseudomonas TaxID=196821 RepID=UPI002AB3E72C|nr:MULTISPECIES: efflux RND transporter permease subunit [unclassified Pseudomonas]MDY7560684.1 efflux RND transporter permease subunit [Pseudomonas sp. AB6]MEA9996078.1 efflux RND transporter permease subunit [Pseudomonas sp. AA4]MEB0087401.1 efflux RND transporter permease subunit [Pseudomonas sp. RTI1]MEB0127973.1 efflux RND transporter permease subunit [Pseudomonas sp. CCC1.2]MEB0154743.1 efflux RND transporter permease subunit [Pseudomonas sp. CCC4.3]
MLNSIIRFAVRLRGVVIALACLLAGYGIFTLTQARQDVFPEFAPPLAVIQTEAPGLSSEQVEMLVTQSVENAMGGTLDLASMRSKSLPGLSMVTLTFKDGADIYRARQLTAERLSTLTGILPHGVKPPALLPLTSSTSVTLVAGITSETRSLMELRTLAQWTIKPQLLRVPGVADVIVFGGDLKQFQIQANPEKLVQYGLSLQDILGGAQRATGVSGAGFLETANQRIVLNTEGQTVTPEQLAQTVLNYRNGVAVRLGDVASVAYGAAPAVGAAAIEGKPAVSLMVESQYGADMMSVSSSVESALNSLKPALDAEQVSLHPDIFRPARFIETAIGHLQTALLLGGVLVVLVLFLFLLNIRTAIISATAIPLSLLTAVIVLHHFGVSLNTMTLGGLAIALGEVVDDAVVDVENIFRRLRQNQALEHPISAALVVLRASYEVRSAVVYATLVVVLIFLPVLALSGIAGKLFAPLGLAYILAILASLVVALTVTPALAFMLLTTKRLQSDEPKLVQRLKTRYLKLLASIESHSRPIVWMIVILCTMAASALPFFGGNFIPELKEGHYLIHMALAPGSSLTESMRVGNRVAQELSKVPGVRLVAQRAGRASEVVDPTGVHVSEFEVDLNSVSAAEETKAVARIQQVLASFPGLTTSVNTFLTERVDESISGVTAPVVINVFGPDLDVLDSKAQEIAQVISQIPGNIGLRVESAQHVPQLTIRLRPEQLTHWGFEPVDVMDAIQVAYDGVTASQIYQGNQTYDVTVSLASTAHHTIATVGSLLLRSKTGTTVPLDQLAVITQTTSRYQIMHSGAQRLQTVSTAVRGRAVSDFVQEAKRRINQEVTLPKGTYVLFAGEEQARVQSQQDLMVYTAVAIVGIIILLFLALKSIRALILVLVNLPFALVGGVLTVLIYGGNLSLGSLVGFVTLFGITLRNSIMLISHYSHLVNEEGMTWGPEAARRGAAERLVPILMTAVVTALGLLPLALASGAAGNEIEGPMAIVILGGLVSSTLLNLLVLPTLALHFGRFERRVEEFPAAVATAS